MRGGIIWMSRIDRIISGEDPGEPARIPLEVCDAIIAANNARNVTGPSRHILRSSKQERGHQRMARAAFGG